jgi:hypothetical protein
MAFIDQFLRIGRNRSDGENIVPPGGGDFDGAFDMLLAFHLAKIKVLFTGTSKKLRDRSTVCLSPCSSDPSPIPGLSRWKR